jgi:hypothetical protein
MELLSDADVLAQADRTGIVLVLNVPHGPAWRRAWTWREFWSGFCPSWVYARNGPYWLKFPEIDAPEDPLSPIEFRGMVEEHYLDLAKQELGR